jgi:hypothetical protein
MVGAYRLPLLTYRPARSASHSTRLVCKKEALGQPVQGAIAQRLATGGDLDVQYSSCLAGARRGMFINFVSRARKSPC